ncbi:GNAT family N-acetyltransferase [Oricola cellulosilytica]|nr:GNAT family N-acetyltransferase [Oricola cellulosilytica]
MRNKAEISFVPVRPDDYPLLERWMRRPHWRQWWGEPAVELGYIRAMVGGRDSTKPFIFRVGGRALGYIQYWSVGDAIRDAHDNDAPWLSDLPSDAIGVDLSIGVESELSKGIGSAVLSAFLRKLAREGYRCIVIDPDETNHRAIRAYEKAGFVAFGRHVGNDGVALLMRLPPDRKAELAR